MLFMGVTEVENRWIAATSLLAARTWYSSEDESVVSSLVMITDIINSRGGKLFFQYRVEREGFDG